ncbi:MAG TPA: hypothetical protein VN370_04975 [Desulfitobacteriaceae bacterium]|jgi:uncharacterized BrkB/YihY/UPF0761 family membrane protein|nr:hypothetical protein [Desulfitobacteriaceae bacterium]
MPKFLIYPIYTISFALILIANVPREEIKRFSIYGIIFGGIIDLLVHAFGYLTGLFSWVNYGPFGFIGVHIFANITWAIFFIAYFYFLPEKKPLNYLYAAAGVIFATIYYNMVIDLGILRATDRIILPLVGFSLWFSTATWGYYKLRNFIENKPG